jgi:hypothetical protein
LTPGDGAASDAPGDTSMLADTLIDMPVTQPGPCNATGTADVRLCFRFEGDMQDGSGQANHAVATGHSFVAGASGLGVDTSQADIQVPDDSSLNLNDFTITMKINPASLPTVTRQGLIENDTYRMFVQPGGGIRCAINDGTAQILIAAPVVAGIFTRVTCTYDRVQLRLYYDGSFMGSANANANLDSVNTETTIGQSQPFDPAERFNGVIDDLLVFGTIEPP